MGKADQQIYVLIYDPKAGSLVLLFESSFKGELVRTCCSLAGHVNHNRLQMPIPQGGGEERRGETGGGAM